MIYEVSYFIPIPYDFLYQFIHRFTECPSFKRFFSYSFIHSTHQSDTNCHYLSLSLALILRNLWQTISYKSPGKYDIKMKYSGGQKKERKKVVFSDPEEEARLARLQAEARARSGVPEKSILKPPPGTLLSTSLQYNPMSLGNLLGRWSSFSVAHSVSL